jgi:hypothetical protein
MRTDGIGTDTMRTELAALLAALGLLCFAPVAHAQEDEDGDEEEGGGEDDLDLPSGKQEDDVDNWSYEGEDEKPKVETKDDKPKKVELPPEPKRYGTSGHWYQVEADCSSCETLLGQRFAIEDPLVMRQYFDYFDVAADRKSAEFNYPSISETRDLGVNDRKDRLIIWQYVVETGTRLTDTYATVWDLRLMADGGLLYGRKYEVQAWTEDAYTGWERGYKSDPKFIDTKKLLSYVDLAPVEALTVEKGRFQVGESARINFSGYVGFVRTDVSREAIAAEQQRLKDAAEAEKKRVVDQKAFFKKGEAAMDDKAWDDAIAAFRKSRELGLDTLDLKYNLGFCYYKQKDFDQAKTEYRALLDVDPRDTDVRYNLARIFEKEKNFDAAIKEYQAILKFDPDDGAARERLEVVRAARDMLTGD